MSTIKELFEKLRDYTTADIQVTMGTCYRLHMLSSELGTSNGYRIDIVVMGDSHVRAARQSHPGWQELPLATEAVVESQIAAKLPPPMDPQEIPEGSEVARPLTPDPVERNGR